MGTLRFLLAISVVIAHSTSIFGFTLVGGELSVKAFYIISGFYMALVLKEKYAGINNSYKLFITNRFLRLYPIYWVILILTLLYSLAVFIYSDGNNLGKASAYQAYFPQLNIGSFVFLVFTNLFLFFQDTVMFLGLNTLTGTLFVTTDFQQTSPQLHTFLLIPQAWTIGIELYAFYQPLI